LKVLLPLDPEEEISDLTHLVCALLRPERTHLRRYFVHRPIGEELFLDPGYAKLPEIARLEFEAENASRVCSERGLQQLEQAGFLVSAEVVRGSPTAEVLREARLWPADLLAVRARRADARDERLGGMATALLTLATCPVLTYREVPADYRVRRILIPTDFTPASRMSSDWGFALAEDAGARVDLLHVLPEGRDHRGIESEDLVRMAAEELETWRQRAGRLFSPRAATAEVISAGLPSEGILETLRAREHDLVVLAASRISAVHALLLGSNTRRVVRWSPVPALVIPSSNRAALEVLRRGAAAVEHATATT
jgi:nucleotide-binding universal stress UspA family protein